MIPARESLTIGPDEEAFNRAATKCRNITHAGIADRRVRGANVPHGSAGVAITRNASWAIALASSSGISF